MKKFLIIRFSSIGDIVLTTPVFRCLRSRFPEAEIHFLTKNAYNEILAFNPYINKIHIAGNKFDDLLKELKRERYDYIIDLHNNLRTLKVKRFLRSVPSFSFNKLNIGKFIYTRFKINILPQKHIVDRYLETVESLGVINDGKGLDYFICEADQLKINEIPFSHLSGYIGIVIGAAWKTKKLPLHKLIELCRFIQHPIILLGGKEDFENGEQIAFTDNIKIYNACGKFSINTSADLVRKAKCIITHDTGLMHIAAAFQKPIISVWGNTTPAFGMYPYYGTQENQRSQIVEINKLWCRPCSKIGYNKCPLGHFKCMEQININEIVSLVNKCLQV
jgi:ADP-heptose:LPS heptosyltransferase